MGNTYKDSGVNIEAGEAAVNSIKEKIKSTFSPNVLSGIGHFGAFYDASFKDSKKPVLVSSTDGVGTKLKVAYALGIHHTVGQDIVNHCVDDILTSGAKPLFFLDYIGTGVLSPDVIEGIIDGMVTACRENDCSLVGGEMAEMPGIYQDQEYDISGTIVGLVERDKIINGSSIKAGQQMLALRSTGLHTNGYSLARKVLFDKYKPTDHIKEFGKSVGEELLTVHKSYLHPVQALLKKVTISGISHITGGGIIGNTNRIFAEGLDYEIFWDKVPSLPIFDLIQKTGNVSDEEMRKVFNLGIGMIMILNEEDVDTAQKVLKEAGEDSLIIGKTVEV